VAQALRAASGLGYLLQFLDLAAHYLDSPVFHVLCFQASTSQMYFPNRFWDRYPSDICGIDALAVRTEDPEPAPGPPPAPKTG
jgi:hypothetical protein